MKGVKYSDKELFSMIIEGRQKRENALRFIYLYWRSSVLNIVRSKGYKTEETEDAIHDGVILLDKKIRNGDCTYQKEGALKNYFTSMCNIIAYTKRRSQNKTEYVEDKFKMDSVSIEDPHLELVKEESKSVINKLLSEIGEVCKDLLSYYKLGYTYKEIALEFDLGDENNARQRAFDCRKKMKKLIVTSSELTSYFKLLFPDLNIK